MVPSSADGSRQALEGILFGSFSVSRLEDIFTSEECMSFFEKGNVCDPDFILSIEEVMQRPDDFASRTRVVLVVVDDQ